MERHVILHFTLCMDIHRNRPSYGSFNLRSCLGYYDHLILDSRFTCEDASHLVKEPNQHYPVRSLRNLRPHYRSSCFFREKAKRMGGCVLKQGKLPNGGNVWLRLFLDWNMRWFFQHLLRCLCWSVGLQHCFGNLSEWSHLYLDVDSHHLRLRHRPLRSDCGYCGKHSIWWLAFRLMKGSDLLRATLLYTNRQK